MIYVVGGKDESGHSLGTVIMYDPSKDLWTSCPEMNERRAYLGVAVLNGLIYAVGGCISGNSGKVNLIT
jgi:hypothetical protein